MTDDERLLSLWTEGGLLSEGIGPHDEWSPAVPAVHQARHEAFWNVAGGIIPEDEHDEPYWMTQDATRALLANN